MDSDYLRRRLACVDKDVHRLGLACRYGIRGEDVQLAVERGLNFLFWTWQMFRVNRALRELARQDRERLVIVSAAGVAYTDGMVRRSVERALRALRTDYLDVFLLGWLGRASRASRAVFDALVQLRECGKVRAVGCSIHDRRHAGRLAAEGVLDVLMIRYNAAHPGAEQDIFPHQRENGPNFVAYTATRWTFLLKPQRGWTGHVPDAGDCYRFCLANPQVDVVLTAPRNREELLANIKAVESRPPLAGREMDEMRAWGRVVHDRKVLRRLGG
jgi:aryl-alcohol dehydrogenase-like predicted oxidoreductase